MTYAKQTLMAFSALAALTLASVPANAALNTLVLGSEIDFNGGVNPIGGADTYNATGLDFRTNGNASIGTPGSLGLTNSASGNFTAFSAAACASSALGGCGTIADLTSFVVASNTLVTPALPIANFITFTQGAQSVSFTLDSFTIANVAPSGTSLGTTTISGLGELNYVGFTPTAAIFTVTSQGTGNTSFSGSLVSQGVPVPEPSSMLMLLGGVASLGFVVRSRKPASFKA